MDELTCSFNLYVYIHVGSGTESCVENAVKKLLSKEELKNIHVNTLVADGKTTVAFFR